MPHLHERVLLRAFRQRNESGRIHYIAAYADSTERRLYVDDGNPPYAVLESHLLAQDYTGPASGAEAEAEQ
jgi:hypothetical protein